MEKFTVNLSGCGIFCIGRILTIGSISLIDTDVFRLSVFFYVNFGRLYLSIWIFHFCITVINHFISLIYKKTCIHKNTSTEHIFDIIILNCYLLDLLQIRKIKVLNVSSFISSVTKSCLTLNNPMDCNLSGSSVHGILQATMLAWVAIFFSRGSSWPRNETLDLCIEGRFFTNWAMREAHLYLCLLWSSSFLYWDLSFWILLFFFI